jgi:hypothetical protein
MRMCVFGLKVDFETTDLCEHASSEDKSERKKGQFCEILERTYMKCSSYDVGNFSDKVGKRKWASTVVGDHSLHNESSGNGMIS